MGKKIARNILKQPYERVLIPEDEGFSAAIKEFEGCYAYGKSANQALNNLEDVASAWIEAQLEKGEEIPRPLNEETYSGRFALRMSKSLHQQLARFAESEGVSLNQYINSKLSASTGEARLLKLLDDKLEQPKAHGLNLWNTPMWCKGEITQIVTGVTGPLLGNFWNNNVLAHSATTADSETRARAAEKMGTGNPLLMEDQHGRR